MDLFYNLNISELPILNALQSIHNPVLDWIMIAFSFICEHGEIWIAAGVIMLIFKRTRRGGIMLLASLAIGFLVTNLTIKPLFARTRPYDMTQFAMVTRDQIAAIGAKIPKDLSFPSGHATASFASAFALLFFDKKHFGFEALAVAIIIAFSRLYLYIHYPTDILAGLLIGLAAAVIVFFVTRFIFKKIDQRKVRKAAEAAAENKAE